MITILFFVITKMTRIVAICGKKRSGKDTIADYISSRYGYDKVKFANVLKDLCKNAFNLSNYQVEYDGKDVVDTRYDKTPRQIMQYIGTDLMQFEMQKFMPKIGRLVWTTSLLESTKNKYIVISDMRFKHEAEEVLRYDPSAIILMVDRLACNNVIDTHVSENATNDIPFNFYVKNDKGIEDLHKIVDDMMKSSQIL